MEGEREGGERVRERERERERENKTNSSIVNTFQVSKITYPDPLPPTRATFFPAGTLKSSPFKIGRSGV